MNKALALLGYFISALVIWGLLFVAFSIGITAELDHQEAVTKQYQAEMAPEVLEACIHNN